jgi:short-subunit dehydrogenase
MTHDPYQRMNSPFSLDNYVVIITGAGGAIGGATAEVLAAVGANVVVSDLNLDTAQAVAGKVLKETGKEALAIKTDVKKEANASVTFSGSAVGTTPSPEFISHSNAKAALLHMSKSIAALSAPSVRSNSIVIVREIEIEFFGDPSAHVIGYGSELAVGNELQHSPMVPQYHIAQRDALHGAGDIPGHDVLHDPEGVVHQIE